MTLRLKQVSVSLLAVLLLLIQAPTWAEETVPANTPSPEMPTVTTQNVTYSFTQRFEPRREGEEPRSPVVLGRKLDAYNLTLQNNGPHPVQILSGTITNHLNPEEAYAKAKLNAGKQYTILLATGIACMPFTFGLSLVLDGLILGPLAAMSAGNHNQRALTYINQNSGQIPTDTLQPGQNKQYSLITLKGVKPDAKLTLMDLQTQQEWTLPEGSQP